MSTTDIKGTVTATPNPDTGCYDLRLKGNYIGCVAGPMTMGTLIPTGPTGKSKKPLTEKQVKTKLKGMFPGAQIVVESQKKPGHPALKGMIRA